MTTKNRKKTALVTASLATLMLATGTFAWTSISQQALNEKEGQTDVGGRIHDDYNKASGNKDIYAENYQTQNLLVRIKLSEYMEDNGNPMVAGTSKTDKKTWTPYTLSGSTTSDAYRKYVTWDLGGDKVFLPTYNKNNTDKKSDASGDAIDVLTNGQTAPGDGEHIFFIAGQKYDSLAGGVPISEQHVAKNTLKQDAAPMSMADWKKAGSKPGKYWVIDTDGWAYWAEILAPGESTSLLLTQLNWDDVAIGDLDNWYYGIDVVGEFATKSEVSEFDQSGHGAPSADAAALLEALAKTTSTFDVAIGETFQFDGKDYIYLKDMEDGNRLILSKETIGSATTSLTYNGSNLDAMMKAHYDSLSADAKKEVQPVQKTFTVGEPMDDTAVGLDLTDRFLVSTPFNDRTEVTEGSAGEKKAFALSLADLNDVSGPEKAFDTVESRGATDASGQATEWWLRSPGTSPNAWGVLYGALAGQLYDFSTMADAYGARAAFIIHRY